MKSNQKSFVAVSLIPTGIRCSIGGYIGDATGATNMLASACDYLITNPNAVNASAFNFKEKNVLYVEGYAIDRLFKNELSLKLPKKNRVGIVMEKMSDSIAMKYNQKTIEAFSTVAGIEIGGIEYIKPFKKKITKCYGQLVGSVENVDPLLAAARKLRDKQGAEAIAIATYIPVQKSLVEEYQRGLVPNPYGQMEALLSHTVIRELGIPAAHGPLLTKKEMDFFLYQSFDSDPRGALENVCPAYIGSILLGLSTAPCFAKPARGAIALSDVRALIVPAHCLRSIPVAKALKRGIRVIEVAENANIFGPLAMKIPGVTRVTSYDSALSALKRLRRSM